MTFLKLTEALTYAIENPNYSNEFIGMAVRTLYEEQTEIKDAMQTAVGLLADIAYNDDMTLKLARKKADRIYRKLAVEN